MNDDLRLALTLADAADVITMRHFRRAELAVRTKSDLSPVSEADEAAEAMIRETLGRERPDDGIVGEEMGASGSAQRRWIIDPIDGTKNYVRGVPVFGTLIALEKESKPCVGVVSAPALHHRWWASKGDGAFCNRRSITVSTTAFIRKAFLGYDSIADFDGHGLGDQFLELTRACERSRGFGDFWTHMLVAEGAIDIAIEPRVAHWDMAAVQIIVEEAGGRFTSLRGEARPDGGSALSTNGRVHDQVLEMMR